MPECDVQCDEMMGDRIRDREFDSSWQYGRPGCEYRLAQSYAVTHTARYQSARLPLSKREAAMAYTVDESDLARQQGLSDILDPITMRFLDSLSLPEDARCLDVGCGLGYTTRLLTAHLPAPQNVIGVDADPDLVGAARDKRGEDAVAEFREADATDLPFPDDTFDLVFGRFLLAHVPEPEAVVREYSRVARDGALILVQEPDFQSIAFHPPSPSHQKSIELAGQLFDIHIGRKCWHLLRDAGLEDLSVRADVPVEAGPGDLRLRSQSVRSISAIGPAILQKGFQTEPENEDMMRGVREAAQDEDRFMMLYTTVSVAGRA